jgi:hypothetical protein
LDENVVVFRGRNKDVINRMIGFALDAFQSGIRSETPRWRRTRFGKNLHRSPSGNAVLVLHPASGPGASSTFTLHRCALFKLPSSLTRFDFLVRFSMPL